MNGKKEIIEYRTPNTKHFLKKDGTIEVEIYKDPVHYLEKGEYKEIDNSLVKTTKGFKNKSNDFKVEFNENDSDSLVNISCKNKKISMFPKNMEQKISNRTLAKKTKSKIMLNDIKYENMYDDVDIDYKIFSNQLKESIILNRVPNDNRFTFVINTDLNLILNDDNTISFKDEKNECYRIERPYMVDNNGIYSELVKYELNKLENGYEIIIDADKEWLNDNERAYPVTIDPTITNVQSSTSVIDTYIFDGDSNVTTYNQPLLCVGADKDTTIYRSLLKFELPKVPAGYKVTEANLILSCYPDEFGLGYLDNVPMVSVHALTQDWTEEEAKWSNMNNKYSNHIEDYYLATRMDSSEQESGYEYKDKPNITSLVQKWYNGEPNYGIMLKEYKEEIKEKSRPAYYVSKDYNSTSYLKPLISVTYKNFNGLESYLSYTTQKHDFGDTFVNNYTGNLTSTFNVASTIGGSFPVNLYLIYNTTDVELNEDYGYGLGVKPNLMRTIEKDDIEDEEFLKYIDADGTVHYFYKKIIDYIKDVYSNEYYDEDGLGLSIEFIENDYILKDKDSNTSKFVKHLVNNKEVYFLEEISDTNGKKIQLIYNNNKITKVIDADNKEINITYGNNSISFASPHMTTTITLTNNLLTTIEALGIVQDIAYNNYHLIEKIVNSTGTSIKYEYISQISYRVRKISELSKNGNLGDYLVFSYNLGDTKITDKHGHINTYIFNNYGNLVGITNLGDQNNLNSACGKSNSFGQLEEGTVNKLTSDNSLIKYVDNLIDDSSFESGKGLSFKSSHMDNTNIASKRYSRTGEYSLEVEIPREGESVYKEFKVEKGKKYTFSAYIKGMSYSIEAENHLDLLLYYDGFYKVTHISELTDDFVRYSVSIDYDINATEDLKVVIRNTSVGHNGFYLDDIQLEEGEVANYYNLVDNSSFKNNQEGWVVSENASEEYSEVVNISDGVKALKIHSEPIGRITLQKKFNIKGKRGDTFNLSFWYKNEGIIPSGGEGIMPGLWATIFFEYADDLELGACVPARYLNVGSENWQFFSENFQAEWEYDYLTIRICNFGAANNCYYTNFSLFKDLESYSYVYDDNGNLVSAIDLNREKSRMNYDKNNQLLSEMNPMGANYVYEYDNKINDRIISSISPTGITNHIEYDNNGNPLKTKINNRNTLAEIDNNKIYYIRAKGTNKYFYINSDKSIRMKEFECSYDKFLIIKHDVVECDETENVKTYYKIKHAILNNYYIKVVDNNVVLAYGDDKNLFELVSNLNKSYSIMLLSDENEPKKALSLNENFKLEVADYEEENYKQEFFIEQVDNKLFIETSAEYTNNGRFIKSIKDSLGNLTNYNIDEENGLIKEVINSKGKKIIYTYDNAFKIKNIRDGLFNVSYNYKNNCLNEILFGSKKYSYEYDEFNRNYCLKLNDRKLVENIFFDNNLSEIKYGNGDIIHYTYDDLDRIKTISKSNELYTKIYDNLGRIAKIKSNNDSYEYEYDFAKRLSKLKINDFVLEYDYNESNGLKEKKEKLLDYKNAYNYVYNTDLNLINLSFNNQSINYNYDELGRLESLNFGRNHKIEYHYITDGYKTSNVIDKIIINGDIYSYRYDELGQINEICKNEVVLNRYVYDDCSQLIQDDDFVNNQSSNYSYDSYGNLLKVKVFDYGTNNLISEDIYDYDAEIPDLLTKFNNTEINYDEIGNPMNIGNRKFEWVNGGELNKYSDLTNSIEYKYNIDGVRIEKQVNGEKINYYLEGSSIVFEKRSNYMLYYTYSIDELIGFVFNGNQYFYNKNIFGDIIGIFDSDWNEIVSYKYDSWGALVSIIDNSNNNLGVINPFRYRSYYYDDESQLYYLNSRYYDPKLRRFIGPDSIIGTEEKLLSFNSYQYSFNNPINVVDSSGEFGSCLKWVKEKAKKCGDTIKKVASTNTGKIAVGVVAIGVGVAITWATGGSALPALKGAFETALIVGGITSGIRTTASVIKSVSSGKDLKSTIKDVKKSSIDGFADGFMAGGISAACMQGTASIFKIATNLGVPGGKNTGINITENIKILSPNARWKTKDIGGTLVNFGSFRIDITSRSMLHIHGFGLEHFPIGATIVGIVEGIKKWKE